MCQLTRFYIQCSIASHRSTTAGVASQRSFIVLHVSAVDTRQLMASGLAITRPLCFTFLTCHLVQCSGHFQCFRSDLELFCSFSSTVLEFVLGHLISYLFVVIPLIRLPRVVYCNFLVYSTIILYKKFSLYHPNKVLFLMRHLGVGWTAMWLVTLLVQLRIQIVHQAYFLFFFFCGAGIELSSSRKQQPA